MLVRGWRLWRHALSPTFTTRPEADRRRPLVSVKVSVRQRKTTMEEARRREAKSVDLPAYSANSPVIAGSLFRLHTAEATGSIPVAPTPRSPCNDRGFCDLGILTPGIRVLPGSVTQAVRARSVACPNGWSYPGHREIQEEHMRKPQVRRVSALPARSSAVGSLARNGSVTATRCRVWAEARPLRVADPVGSHRVWL